MKPALGAEIYEEKLSGPMTSVFETAKALFMQGVDFSSPSQHSLLVHGCSSRRLSCHDRGEGAGFLDVCCPFFRAGHASLVFVFFVEEEEEEGGGGEEEISKIMAPDSDLLLHVAV